MQPTQMWLSCQVRRHVKCARLNPIEEALRKYHSQGFLGGAHRLRSSLLVTWSSKPVPRGNPSKQACLSVSQACHHQAASPCGEAEQQSISVELLAVVASLAQAESNGTVRIRGDLNLSLLSLGLLADSVDSWSVPEPRKSVLGAQRLEQLCA